MTPHAVVKLGGSLLASDALPPLLATLTDLARVRRLLVIPGGGPFADAVRSVCARHRPGPTAAHWMAVLAMDQHAQLLAALAPGAALVSSGDGIAAALDARRLAILAPHRWLRAADPLPHRWDVTSDSIAAWFAARLGAPRLVLLKSVDGVRDARGELIPALPRAALGRVPEVDPWLAHALAPRTRCWIINGHYPRRLRELLLAGETRETRVG